MPSRRIKLGLLASSVARLTLVDIDPHESFAYMYIYIYMYVNLFVNLKFSEPLEVAALYDKPGIKTKWLAKSRSNFGSSFKFGKSS